MACSIKDTCIVLYGTLFLNMSGDAAANPANFNFFNFLLHCEQLELMVTVGAIYSAHCYYCCCFASLCVHIDWLEGSFQPEVVPGLDLLW